MEIYFHELEHDKHLSNRPNMISIEKQIEFSFGNNNNNNKIKIELEIKCRVYQIYFSLG